MSKRGKRMNQRQAKYDIEPNLLKRYSTRSFLEKEVEDKKLKAMIEAASWATSAANWQPWHFIVMKSASERERLVDTLFEGNSIWCQYVPTFIVITSRKTHEETNRPIASHAFDAGAAWGIMSMEGYRQGLMTHPMSGFDQDDLREVLSLPSDYDIQAVVAVGYYDENYINLTDELKEREVPSLRKSVDQIMSFGRFHKKEKTLS